jgi:hypothetical protein
MSRILEGIFVIGCSLVGFGMSAPTGSSIHNAVEQSVRFVAGALPHVLSGASSAGLEPGVRLLIMKHVL